MTSNTNNTGLLLGIDGGGSTCRARICDSNNNVLGEGKAGPANFRLGVSKVSEQIRRATQAALDQAGLSQQPLNTLHAGIGLAGVVLEGDQELAKPIKNLFADCVIRDDAYIACLGAHLEKPGGILILGTGSCAQIITEQETRTYGGWGFHIGDHSGGAFLGREAIRLSLLALESIVPSSPLTNEINKQFEYKPQNYLRWSETAKPQQYAQFAPQVFNYAGENDFHASRMIENACKNIKYFIDVLARYNTGRIALLGGLSTLYPKHLSEDINQKLCLPSGDALNGAIIMARNLLKENQCK